MTRGSRSGVVLALACALPGFSLHAACGADEAGESKDRVEVAVKALELEGVGDISYALAVTTPTGTVWSRTGLRASTYGNGQSMTYVGPCDASFAQNTVTLTIEALYDTSNIEISRESWVDPGAISRPFACTANADTLVELNLVILRSANQGFFDIAVNFEDVFCSAKLDCKRESDTGDVALELLHDPRTGLRAPSSVLAFACTAGPGADTHLYMQRVTLVCGTDRIELPVGRDPGNVYSSDEPAPPPLVQFATYRGLEQLVDPTTGEDLAKRYWNLAFAIDPDAVNRDCRLETALTVSDGPLEACTTPALTTWPVIVVDTPFVSDTTNDFACVRHPIGTGAGEPVRVTYTEIETAMTFAWEASAQDGALAVRPCDDGPAGDGPVTVTVFADLDGDGTRDAGEPVRAGVDLAFTGPAPDNNESLNVTSEATPFPLSLTPGTWTFEVQNLGEYETLTTPNEFVVTATASALSVGIAPAPRVEVIVASGDSKCVGAVDIVLVIDQSWEIRGTTDENGRYETTLPVNASWSVAVGEAAGCNPPQTADATSGVTTPASLATVTYTTSPMPVVSISLYSDDDASGSREAGEEGVPSWPIALLDPSTSSYVYLTSDSQGDIVTLPGELAPNTTYLVDWSNSGSGSFDTWVTPSGVTFTTGPTGAQTLSLGLVPLPEVTVVQFVDTNGNGSFDPSDEQVAGLALSLADGLGSTWYAGPGPAGSWQPQSGPATLSWQLDSEFGSVLGASLGAVFSPNPDPTGTSLGLEIPPAYDGTLAVSLTRVPVITGILVQDSAPVGTTLASDPPIPTTDICLADPSTLVTVWCVPTDGEGRFDFAGVDRETLCDGCTYAIVVPNPPSPELFDLGSFVPPVVTLAPNGVYDLVVGLPLMPTVSGQIFHDANGNGLRDAGEPTLTASRVKFDGGPTLETLSSDSYSTLVLPGTYLVSAEDDTGEFGMPASVSVEVGPGENIVLDLPMRRFPVARVLFAVDSNRSGAYEDGTDALVQTSVSFRVDDDPSTIEYSFGSPVQLVRPVGPITFDLSFGGMQFGYPRYWTLYSIVSSGEGDMVLVTGPGLADHGAPYPLGWDESPLFVFMVYPRPQLSVSTFEDRDGDGMRGLDEMEIGATIQGSGNNDSSFTGTFLPGSPLQVSTMPSGGTSFFAEPLGEDWAQSGNLYLIIAPGAVRSVAIPIRPMPLITGTVTNPGGPTPSGLLVEVLVNGEPVRIVPVQTDGSFAVVVPNGTLGLSEGTSANISVRVTPTSIPSGFDGTEEGEVTLLVTPGQSYLADFTLVPEGPTVGTLAVTLFHDQNGDGQRQVGEPPVTDASANVSGSSQSFTITPGEMTGGTFELTVTPGTWSLLAEGPGHRQIATTYEVELTPGQTVSFDLPMGAFPVVTGLVTDATTLAPVPDATVSATLGTGTFTATTDIHGAYAIPLGPGALVDTTTVSVELPPGYLSSTPSTATLGGLALNDRPSANFELEPEPPVDGLVRGHVYLDDDLGGSISAGDRNLGGLEVGLYDLSYGLIVSTFTDSEGFYELEVPALLLPGTFIVDTAEGSLHYALSYSYSETVSLGIEEQREFDLLLTPKPFSLGFCFYADADGDQDTSDYDEELYDRAYGSFSMGFEIVEVVTQVRIQVPAQDGSCFTLTPDPLQWPGFTTGTWTVEMPAFVPSTTVLPGGETHPLGPFGDGAFQVPAPLTLARTIDWGDNVDLGPIFWTPTQTATLSARVEVLDANDNVVGAGAGLEVALRNGSAYYDIRRQSDASGLTQPVLIPAGRIWTATLIDPGPLYADYEVIAGSEMVTGGTVELVVQLRPPPVGPGAMVSGTLYLDTNFDDLADAMLDPVEGGALVELYRFDGNTYSFVYTTATDNSGHFSFDVEGSELPGDFIVRAVETSRFHEGDSMLLALASSDAVDVTTLVRPKEITATLCLYADLDGDMDPADAGLYDRPYDNTNLHHYGPEGGVGNNNPDVWLRSLIGEQVTAAPQGGHCFTMTTGQHGLSAGTWTLDRMPNYPVPDPQFDFMPVEWVLSNGLQIQPLGADSVVAPAPLSSPVTMDWGGTYDLGNFFRQPAIVARIGARVLELDANDDIIGPVAGVPVWLGTSNSQAFSFNELTDANGFTPLSHVTGGLDEYGAYLDGGHPDYVDVWLANYEIYGATGEVNAPGDVVFTIYLKAR